MSTPYILLVVFLIFAFPFFAYALSLRQIFFTQIKEGRAVSIVRGGDHSHFILSYRGHLLNDPRTGHKFDTEKPAWEVLQHPEKNTNKKTSAYRALSPWRILERLGIYYYGFWPFFKIDYQWQDWVEEKQNSTTGHVEPWIRHEYTGIIYVAAFTYRFRLPAAENSQGFPTTLDYNVVIEVTNLFTVRYRIADFMKRLIAECNGASRKWVAERDYNEATADISTESTTSTSFALMLLNLNTKIETELETESKSIGLPEALGVSIRSASLQEVTLVGVDAGEISKATVAKGVAELQAEATVATAQGNAKAVLIAAEAEKNRITTVYGAVQEFGEAGLVMRQLDAVENSSQGPGNTIVWANNPLGPWLASLFERKGPASPTSNPTSPTE